MPKAKKVETVKLDIDFASAESQLIKQVDALLLKQLEELKITKSELAKRLDVHQTEISRVLSGGNLTLKKVADLFAAMGLVVELEVVRAETLKPAEPKAKKVKKEVQPEPRLAADLKTLLEPVCEKGPAPVAVVDLTKDEKVTA